MQIVTKLPNENIQNYQLQMFNSGEGGRGELPNAKWLRMTQNGQFCLIHNFFKHFPLKWLGMTRNSQFCPICNFSNLFRPKWLRMTQSSQFHPIHYFSNLFPPKWLRMTRSSQFCLFTTFPIFSHQSGSE